MDPNVVRQEVDEIVGSLTSIVEMAISVGKGDVDKMALALHLGGQLPALFMNGLEFSKAAKGDKVEYALETFDALTGTDEHSLFDSLPFLDPETTEQMFDMAKGGLRKLYEAKFGDGPTEGE